MHITYRSLLRFHPRNCVEFLDFSSEPASFVAPTQGTGPKLQTLQSSARDSRTGRRRQTEKVGTGASGPNMYQRWSPHCCTTHRDVVFFSQPLVIAIALCCVLAAAHSYRKASPGTEVTAFLGCATTSTAGTKSSRKVFEISSMWCGRRRHLPHYVPNTVISSNLVDVHFQEPLLARLKAKALGRDKEPTKKPDEYE